MSTIEVCGEGPLRAVVLGADDLDAARWAARSPAPGGLRYDGATVVLPEKDGSGIEGPAR